ncbi:MAG TPA: outer membrane beta-barrel protein, partial [Flavisolibacter sp.]|nr:outer membrane beta-barrel protein [Flavisolibacter sp.]
TGYKAFASDTIVVKDSAIVQLTAQLSIQPAGLQGVVVTAKKPFIERKIDKLVLNVENSSLAAGSTAMEVLEKAPGVSVDKEDNISFQGKQGVLVLLDGKPTYMSNADLANFLRSMQSGQIETIELITNPSAKYDATGSSGIINIRTKKNKSLGANGSITAGAGYGETWKYNGNLSANYRNQKINLFGNYTHSNNRNKRTIDIERSSNLNGEDTYFSQWGHSERNNRNHNFKAGLDYYLNSKNTIGVLVTGYNNTANEVSGNYTQIGKTRQQSDSAVDTKSSIRGLNKNMAYNINYRSVLDSLGQELTIDADYSRFTSKDRSAYDNYYLHPQGGSLKDPYFMKNTTPSTISIKAFKADYVYPYSREMKLEMGVKSSWVKTGNDLWFEELIGGAWQNNSSRSNRFIYDEKINAAYINVSRAFKATSIQTGLRAEHTSSTGNSVTTGKIVKRRYLDFFPSVFVHQTLSEKNTLSFSYSRRVDRPNYQSLNPFVYFLDQYTYEQGNPFLNPQYTHSLEMTYAYKRKYSATVGYNLTRAVMMEVILPDTSNKALYQTTLNLDQQRFYNLTLNAPVRISKWWNTNSNITLFHMSFKAPDLKGLELNAGKSGLIVTSNHNFSIAEG